jgi:hypothetical protein
MNFFSFESKKSKKKKQFKKNSIKSKKKRNFVDLHSKIFFLKKTTKYIRASMVLYLAH